MHASRLPALAAQIGMVHGGLAGVKARKTADRPHVSVKARLRLLANRLLAPLDLCLVRRAEVMRFLGRDSPRPEEGRSVPAEVRDYLRWDNPRLTGLRERYRSHPAAAHTKWHPAFVRSAVDLALFRRDNPYVYQTREGILDQQYLLTAYFAKGIDRLGLWRILEEDGAFGCYSLDFNGERAISRDLLDCIIEINSLDRAWNLSGRSDFRLLDIGAGYGRLAHRLARAFPESIDVVCTDAVAESTFLSEFYLGWRGASHRARVVPLDEIEKHLAQSAPEFATNIHSFSECSSAAIEWWIQLLAHCRVPRLLIVSNTGRELLSTEAPGVQPPRRDFSPVLEKAGYRLVEARPKYDGAPSLQEHGLYPTYHLFYELQD